ncbi:hypothetical protein LSAT2_019041, partial [Lamellibrachia satsuma]
GPKVTLLAAFGAGLAVCRAVIRALVPAATMADLTAVCAQRSRQGWGWGMLFENRSLLFPEGADRGSRL